MTEAPPTPGISTLRDRLFSKYAGSKGPWKGVRDDVLALIAENDRLAAENDRRAAIADTSSGTE